MWPQVTGSDPEITSYAGSHLDLAVEGRKLVYTVHFTSFKAAARRRRHSRDRKWRHVTSGDRKLPGSGYLTGSHLEVAVEGRKLAYTVHFISYKAEHAVGGNHITGNDVMRAVVTVSDPEVTSFHRKSSGSSCRRLKTGIYFTFHFLQSCSSQEEEVTSQEMTSRDFRWPEVNREWRDLTGRHLEVAVEGRKLAYTVHFTSYKAIVRRRR